MKISIPETSLVVLIGASGSGKSTFARKHFLPTEIISSDACRALVSDDESSLDATDDAFELVRFLAGKRLARQKLTVIDATNVQPERGARAPRARARSTSIAITSGTCRRSRSCARRIPTCSRQPRTCSSPWAMRRASEPVCHGGSS